AAYVLAQVTSDEPGVGVRAAADIEADDQIERSAFIERRRIFRGCGSCEHHGKQDRGSDATSAPTGKLHVNALVPRGIVQRGLLHFDLDEWPHIDDLRFCLTGI